MSFYEPAFLFMFLPLALALFFGMGQVLGQAGALGALVFGTLIFLSSYGTAFLTVVVASTVLNAIAFSPGGRVAQASRSAANQRPGARRNIRPWAASRVMGLRAVARMAKVCAASACCSGPTTDLAGGRRTVQVTT